MHPQRTAASANAASIPAPAERLIRLEEVQLRTGKARTQIYDAVRAKTFPAPIKDGRNSVWVESEVDAWVADRIANGRRKA